MRKLFVFFIIAVLIAGDSFGRLQKKNHNLIDQNILENRNKVITDPMFKTGYNGGKRLDSIIRYEFTSELDSVKSMKFSYEYDSRGNQIHYKIYEWSDSGKIWNPLDKNSVPGDIVFWNQEIMSSTNFFYPPNAKTRRTSQLFFHDTDDKIRMELAYLTISQKDKAWLWKKEHSVDENGSLTWVGSEWNTVGQEWIPIKKVVTILDERDSIFKEILLVYRWDSVSYEPFMDWKIENKVENKYISSNIFDQTLFHWSSSSNNWVAGLKKAYQYDEELKLIKEDFCDWNSVNNVWECESGYDWTYNYDEGIIQRIGRSPGIWNITDELFSEPEGQFIYDNEGRIIIWIPAIDAPGVIDAYEYEYDSDGNLMEMKIFGYNPGNGVRDSVHERDFYYYSSVATKIYFTRAKDIILFPNPTSGIINFTGLTQPTEVKVFSIQGHLLKSEYQVEKTIDVSDLPAGIYLMNLTLGNTVIRKTIIKK